MENIIAALHLLLRVEVFAVMAGGLVIGLLLGALPGLGSMIGMGILLPLTFGLEPVLAMILLVAVFKGSMLGGAFTGILINVPGTPSAAATAIDGYPLNLKGQSKRALQGAIYGSALGDLLSDIILIVGSISLAIIALKIGPSEIFWVVMFALILTAVFSGVSFWKGILSMSVGLLLGCIGLDPMTHVHRLAIVPSLHFLSELDVVAVMLGIFAFSEIFLRMEEAWKKEKGTSQEAPRSILGPSMTFSDIKDSLKAFFIGTGVGTIFGMIPGLGSIAGSFTSYELTKNAYNGKCKSGKFGEGALPGVVASESANSAVSGANLLPVLVLGIPGSPTAALLLACLMMQGFNVGPRMFVEEAPMLYALFMAFIIANFFNIGLANLLIKPITKMLKASPKIVFPAAMMLCFAGVYSLNNRLIDLCVMVAIGVLAYLMRKSDIPIAPMAIAFVLAIKVEQCFRQTLAIGDYKLLVASPVSKGCILLIILGVVGGLIQRRKSRALEETGGELKNA